MENLRPLVSIIIPVYNGEHYIENCILSVIGQTYKELEIIVVNDGSTDSSPDIICNFEKSDARIKCIHKQNEGLVKARITGISSAHGKYVQYLDSDDTLVNNAITLLVNKAESSQAEIVVAPFFFCEGKQKKISDNFHFEQMSGIEYLRYILCGEAYWTVWSKFHLRSLYDNHIESIDISYGEDVVLSSQLLYYSDKVVSIDIPILNYNVYESSMSHRLDDRAYQDFDSYVSWFEDFIVRKELCALLTRNLACFHIKNTFFRLHWKKHKDTSREMKQVINELQTYPDLNNLLSKRERKIVNTFKISKMLGYLNLLRYSWQNKI